MKKSLYAAAFAAFGFLAPSALACPPAEKAEATQSQPAFTQISDIRRGTPVSVKGQVQKILDYDEFRLGDGTGAVEIYVGPNFAPVKVGERIEVSGWVDDDLKLEIYARRIVRQDGTIIKFDHREE